MMVVIKGRRLGINAKITLGMFGLTAISLALCILVSLQSSIDTSRYSLQSSKTLRDTISEQTTAAMTKMTDSLMLRTARNQAEVGTALLDNVEKQVDILAHFASKLWKKEIPAPFGQHSYSQRVVPPDTNMHSVYFIIKGTPRSSVQREIVLSAAMDNMFIPICRNDSLILSSFLGTRKGLFRAFPWRNTYADDYNFQKREWYESALASENVNWSVPYESASIHELIVACAKRFFASDADTTPAGVVMVSIKLSTLNKKVLSAAVGKNGTTFLLDASGNLIADPEDSTGREEKYNYLLEHAPRFKEITGKMTNQENDVSHLIFRNADQDLEQYVVAYAPIRSTGWSIGVVMPDSQVEASANTMQEKILEASFKTRHHLKMSRDRSLLYMAVIFLIMLMISFLISYLLSIKITRPIIQLSKGAEVIGNGILDYKIDLFTGDEIEELADRFNAMTAHLRDYIKNLQETTAVKEKIESELHVAHQIQTGILPRIFPPFPDRSEIDIFAVMQPAREVGGDFFDFFFIDDNRLCLVIGDVSDKGVPASLLMAITKTLIKTEGVQHCYSPAEILYRVNNLLYPDNEMLMFVTVFCLIIDVQSGVATYASAGHNPPLLCRNGQPAEFLEAGKGMALAIMKDIRCEEKSISLQPGEMLLLYTDGINEAMNAKGQQFSDERLLAVARAHTACTPHDAIKYISNEVSVFTGDAPQSDDITMLALRYLGPEGEGQRG